MNGDSKGATLEALYDRAQRLEQERARYEQACEQVARENDRLRLLKRDDIGKGSGSSWARLVIVLAVIGVVGGAFYGIMELRTPHQHRVVNSTLTHHLMVTSEPPGALVVVNGKEAGRTPHLQPAPPSGSSIDVKVSRDGFGTQQLKEKPGAGMHWHVRLKKALPAEAPGRE